MFCCDTCGKKFSSKVSMEEHVAIHTGMIYSIWLAISIKQKGISVYICNYNNKTKSENKEKTFAINKSYPFRRKEIRVYSLRKEISTDQLLSKTQVYAHNRTPIQMLRTYFSDKLYPTAYNTSMFQQKCLVF